MRLSELRPCDGCRAPLLVPGVTSFRVVRIAAAVVNPMVAGQVLGRAVGAVSLPAAEAMVPEAERAIVELEAGPTRALDAVELYLCEQCFAARGLYRLIVEKLRRSA